MLQTVKSNHSLPITRQVLWSDSQTVLSWIRSDQHKYKQFVAFRIGEIVELTTASDWRYVPSDKNIADVVTKWGSGPPVTSNSPWFNGPLFLYEPESMWPAQMGVIVDVPDEKKACVLFHDASFASPLINVQVTSCWGRLIRIAASVIRFIENCRRKVKGQPILVLQAHRSLEGLIRRDVEQILQPMRQEELQFGEKVLLKQAQREGFLEEIEVLENKRDSNSTANIRKSCCLYQLHPILDADGLIRMDGRLALSEAIPFDQKFPIILPRRHTVTALIIQSYHEKFGHGNRETVFNELRQRFYIPKLRSMIKSVTKDCSWCRVNRCQPKVPLMAPLPVQRVTPPFRPFCSVGVDYLGPVEVSIGRRREKRWIALFTCLAVRAVHLEVVHNLTTEACLMAIRRFICRRGSPNEFFSDNGTNSRAPTTK
ncbi:uncharacterized protein LOC134288340 [Aedes albopictus]|uniref:Integrase zinc-binding domain-containing protein n=1 Tax=Aedes albopictus TaxID=7160 RepID=A0ABM1YBN8_AEDAL